MTIQATSRPTSIQTAYKYNYEMRKRLILLFLRVASSLRKRGRSDYKMVATAYLNNNSKRRPCQSTVETKCDSKCPRSEDKRTLPPLLVMTARKPLSRQNLDHVAVLKLDVGRAIPMCQSYVRELANTIWSALSPHSPGPVNLVHERQQSEKTPEREIKGELVEWTTVGSA